MKHTIEIDEWHQSKQKQHAAEAEGALPQKEAITASTQSARWTTDPKRAVQGEGTAATCYPFQFHPTTLEVRRRKDVSRKSGARSVRKDESREIATSRRLASM
jgi:hypothetical protein